MSIRAFAANMVFLATPPSNGFRKVPWSPKSEYMCNTGVFKRSLFFFTCSAKMISVLVLTICKYNWHALSSYNCIPHESIFILRYEGARSAEALAEFVNSEGGNVIG